MLLALAAGCPLDLVFARLDGSSNGGGGVDGSCDCSGQQISTWLSNNYGDLQFEAYTNEKD